MSAPLVDIEIEIATWDAKHDAWAEPREVRTLSSLVLPAPPAPTAPDEEWLAYDRATLPIRHGIEVWSWRFGNDNKLSEVTIAAGSLGVLCSTRSRRGWESSWKRPPLALAVREGA